MQAIRIQSLKRSFGPKSVLNGVNWQIEPGQRLAISGSNGSGKTTLLRILATLLTPTSGDASIGEHSVASRPVLARRQLAWVPSSDGGFFPLLSGRENILLFSQMHGISSTQAENRIDSALAASELPILREALETVFFKSSSGMRQALQLMKILALDPSVLLLDEPTRSLDPGAREFFWNFLKTKLDRKTVVFSTHSNEEAQSLATHFARLEGGLLVAG